jgi:hypothetical protein
MNQDQRNNQLPPIIVQHIEKLNNKNQSSYQREMYCMILERVRDACSQAVNNYRLEAGVKKVARR